MPRLLIGPLLRHVGVRNGCLMASTCNFFIEITGRGSHGANPGASIDPVVVAAHLTPALQAIVSRETNPWDAAVVTADTNYVTVRCRDAVTDARDAVDIDVGSR